MSTSHPLQGITVLEIGHTVAAPYAGMILAELAPELGADTDEILREPVADHATPPAA